MTNIQIPMIFDVSANGTVYGEDISGDEIITSHINLRVSNPDTHDPSSSEGFINAMANILYSDAGETDVSGVLFYRKSGVDVSGAIGTAIKNLLLKGQLLIHDGNDASEMFGAPIQGKTGIPIGFKQKNEYTVAGADEFSPGHDSTWYKSSFIDNDGAQMHRILIRVASTHMMGHPFAQAFIQENTVENDLSNTDFSLQIGKHMLTGNDGGILEAVSDPSNIINKSLGKRNSLLQTIYEQLFRVNHSLFAENQDDDFGFTNSDTSGVARPLRFAEQNTVTFYIRPRMFFSLDVKGGLDDLTAAVGSVIGISGTNFGTSSTSTLTGTDAQKEEAKAAVFNDIFKTTNSTKATGFKWLVGASDGTEHHKGNNDGTLNQYGTNLRWVDVSGEKSTGSNPSIAMLDAHVWKIRVTLGESNL